MTKLILTEKDVARVTRLLKSGPAVASEKLGVSRVTLRRFCRRHDIECTPAQAMERLNEANRLRQEREAELAKVRAARRAAELAEDTKRLKAPYFAVRPNVAARVEAEAGEEIRAWAEKHGHAKKEPSKQVEAPQRPDRKAIIAKLLREKGPMTALQIRGETGMGRSQVLDHARQMVESGTLHAVRVSGNTFRYHLADGATVSDMTPRQQRRLDVLRAMVGSDAVRASEVAGPLGLHRVQVRDVLYIALRDGEVEKAPIDGWPAYRLTHKGLAAISIQAEAA